MARSHEPHPRPWPVSGGQEDNVTKLKKATRERMRRTGESYTTARAALIATQRRRAGAGEAAPEDGKPKEATREATDG